MAYFVYIVRCADDSLYTGSTTNIPKRLREHNGTKAGAHYTKIRRPVTLSHVEPAATLAKARSREAEIKRMSRKEKIRLIATTSLQT